MPSDSRRAISRRKTKIVATVGPASSSPEVLRSLIKAGMNIARLNFSHGSHDEHSQVLKHIRAISEEFNVYVAVLQDLCGPKVRISAVEGGEIQLKDGESITLRHFKGETGNAGMLFVEAFDPVKVIKAGERILLADGRIQLVAKSVSRDGVVCSIEAGGILRSRSGIAAPESRLNLPCLTEKDLEDLSWGVANAVDYIALSFVSSPRDVIQLKDEIKKRGGDVPVIAKIERAAALDSINEIAEASDALMVARGDLGLELPLERVPVAQRLIIETANYHGTPVITATQMLQSMVTEVRPTRAEVSDVSTAVLDGSDAVMLSEETAIGKHPISVVEVLDRIVQEAEKEFQFETFKPRLKGSDSKTVADAICYAACGAGNKVSAAAIVACTQGGYTARLVAKYRPQQILFGATSERKTLAKMVLYWGVHPLHFEASEEYTAEDEINAAIAAARDQYGLKPGSRVVVTAGLKAKRSGTTNLMEIREIPRIA